MYTENKYNTAICTYIAVTLGTAATTVLMVWSLVWSRDSILFYVSGQSTVHRFSYPEDHFAGTDVAFHEASASGEAMDFPTDADITYSNAF